MKKILAASVILAAALLAGCSGDNSSPSSSDSTPTSQSTPAQSSASPAEKAASLLKSVEFAGEMVAVEADNMEFQLGFSNEGLTEFAAYVCGSAAAPDEFGVFSAETGDKASEIKTALEKRIEKQKATYADYSPDEMYKFDDCFVKQDGNLVYYAITADNAKAAEILG